MDLKPGTRVGDYEIIAPIGAGGMGEVYRADDRRLRRQVALKILPREVAYDPQRKQRFMQEAHAASVLAHPHICVIHELGEASGLLFISMEYVEGETLAERLRRGPMSAEEIVKTGAQIADAIDDAHAKGITHRDLKPANIMISTRGHAKVLDFGLAKLQDDSSPVGADDPTGVVSVAGVIMGTVPYMSPEQAIGRTLDHRTDIFSLGAILYEMATGQLPFAGTTNSERIGNIIHAAPVPPSRIRPDVPAGLERVILKCLEKDPSHRYQTAHELEADLRDSARAVAQPRVSRGPAWRTAAVISVLALALAIVLAVVLRGRLTAHSEVESLAVLPFLNTTHDDAIDYLSDGISDSLIDTLSQLPKLRVMARSTAFHYKGQAIDPKRIGKELGVGAILTGSVTTRGGELDIRAELIRSVDGSQIWGSSYSGQTTDAASFQQRIAADVTRVIRGRFEAGAQQERISKRGTDDPEAFQLYLKGQYARNRVTNDSLLTAARLFEEAIRRDPNFALAYVGLADTYLEFEAYVDRMAMESLPKARAAALKALEIDDTMAEAYASLAMVHFNSWEWEESEKNFKRSIELNPNYGQAHLNYAKLLVTMSRLPEAVQQMTIAQRLEPLSPLINSEAAGIKIVAGRTDEGVADLQRVIEVEPNHHTAHQWLAFGYLRQNKVDAAIKEADREVETSGRSTLSLANSGYLHHVAGRTQQADAAAGEVIRRVVFTPPLDMACAYIILRDRDTAFQWLDRGINDHSQSMNYITWPPWFDEIHEDPRYAAILRRMGLRKYNR